MNTLMDPAIADTGEVTFRKGIKIRYLSQQPSFENGQTVRDILYQSEHPGLDALRDYEAILASGNTEGMQAALDKVEATGGWHLEGRIRRCTADESTGHGPHRGPFFRRRGQTPRDGATLYRRAGPYSDGRAHQPFGFGHH